jgi:hypothetical protein
MGIGMGMGMGPGSLLACDGGHSSMLSVRDSSSSNFQLHMPLSSNVKKILVSNEVLDEVSKKLILHY